MTLLPGLARVLAWVGSTKIRQPASLATAPCIGAVLVPSYREEERVKKRKKRKKGETGRRNGDYGSVNCRK